MADGRKQFRDFMARVKAQRTEVHVLQEGKNKKAKKVIDSIVVQRVNSQPSGKLKKYEPLDARDIIDFSNYGSLTLNNVKEASENF